MKLLFYFYSASLFFVLYFFLSTLVIFIFYLKKKLVNGRHFINSKEEKIIKNLPTQVVSKASINWYDKIEIFKYNFFFYTTRITFFLFFLCFFFSLSPDCFIKMSSVRDPRDKKIARWDIKIFWHESKNKK